MDTKTRPIRRPLNHSYKSDYYWDHDKRLHDALVAQNGQEFDDEFHADGIHRKQFDPFGQR